MVDADCSQCFRDPVHDGGHYRGLQSSWTLGRAGGCYESQEQRSMLGL